MVVSVLVTMVFAAAVRRYSLSYRRRGGPLYREASSLPSAGSFRYHQQLPSDPRRLSRISPHERVHCCRCGPLPRPPRCTCCAAGSLPPRGSVRARSSGGGTKDANRGEQERHNSLPTKITASPSRTQADGGSTSSSTTRNLDGDSLLLRLLGPRWSPYGRLSRVDKPAGSMLLLFPCWWSIALAAPMHTVPDVKLLAQFAAGAVVMR